MRTRYLMASFAVAALVLGGLSGCAPSRTLTLDGIEIQKANDSLSALDASFAKQAKSKQPVAVAIPDEARCYFQAATNDAISSAALCGPIWYLGDDDPTWLSQDLNVNSSGMVTGLVGGFVAAPDEDKSLYRTDGKSYDADIEITEPATANTVKAGSSIRISSSTASDDGLIGLDTIDEFVDASRAVIYTPDFVLGFSAGGVKARVGGADHRYATSAGSEFAYLNLYVMPLHPTMVIDGEYPSLEVTADNESYPVDTEDFSLIMASGEITDLSFGVSIPAKAKDIDLQVTFHGLNQTVNFNTLERTSTTANGFYNGPGFIDVQQNETNTYTDSSAIDGWHYSLSGGEIRATRSPFGEKTWAESGLVWIKTELTLTGGTTSYGNVPRAYTEVYDNTLTGSAMTLSDQAGETFSAVTSTVTPDNVVVSYFQIPEDVVELELGGTVSYDMKRRNIGYAVDSSPSEGSAHFPAPAYALNFAKE